MARKMTGYEIERYLKLVGQELVRMSPPQQGTILLLGGAVMILMVGNRSSTQDIDAVLESNARAIRQAARKVAQQEKLDPDWLNDGAKGFIYSQPPVSLWRQYPGLDVFIPSLEYILAMKLVAGRPQDIRDAKALIWHLSLSMEAVLELLQLYIPSQHLTARVQYIVEDLFF